MRCPILQKVHPVYWMIAFPITRTKLSAEATKGPPTNANMTAIRAKTSALGQHKQNYVPMEFGLRYSDSSITNTNASPSHMISLLADQYNNVCEAKVMALKSAAASMKTQSTQMQRLHIINS